MPALDWITIEGFKSIKCIEKLKLGPKNVLIGPNGSGKSNFIEAFSFLNAIRNGRLKSYVAKVGGADRILHFGSKTTTDLTIYVSFENERNQYKITLSVTEDDSLFPVPEEELAFFWGDKSLHTPYQAYLSGSGGEAGISRSDGKGIEGHVLQHLDRWRLYQFHDTSFTSPIKKAADVNDNRHLRPDGANLAAFLYLLRERYERSYDLIRRTVQLVAPFFDDFQLEPLALDETKIRLEWRHRGTDAYFDVSSLSDGSLRFIALATLLLQPERYRPSVIIMDEPELGLHPYAITVLASLIEQASAKGQIILATQSSLLLDHFSPEDVLVADRVNGATELTRLDEERLKEWLEEYSLGQLWEKNEIGGRPSPENRGQESEP